jgi:DNA-binding response OmpR family regulator
METPTPVRILVVVTDPSVLDAVFHALNDARFNIFVADNVENAHAYFLHERPDVVILSLSLANRAGWTLLRKMREAPEPGTARILALTGVQAAQERLEALRLGADDCVAVPFVPEELGLRVGRMLERLQQLRSALAPSRREEKSRDMPGLQGSLEQIGLSSLLLMLEIEKKSGVLVLTSHGDVDTARIFLRAGAIVSARLEGKELPKNEAVLYSLLGWHEGRFLFRSLAVDLEDEIHATTSALLLEGTRRLDESRRSDTATLT